MPSERVEPRELPRLATIAFATAADVNEAPVLKTTAALAIASGALLVSVHAADGAEPARELPRPEELAHAWGKELRSAVVLHTRCEDVTDTLLDALHRVAADLVVCGSHRRHALSQLVAGSVAEALARNVSVPTLVVPLDCEGLATPNGRLQFGRVVVTAGDTESARAGLAAIEWLSRATETSPSEIVLLEIEDGTGRAAVSGSNAGVSVRREPAQGPLEASIERAARELDAGLLVMATRGHDGIADTLLGSHTERVLRASARPLLIVPLPA